MGFTPVAERKIRMATKKTSIGGQALIEGIMMRGPKVTAMAVRNINTKQITMEEYPTKGQDRAKILKLPFIYST